MNRRKFLITGGLAAAALPFGTASWLRLTRPEQIRFARFPKTRLALDFASAERRVLNLLESFSSEVYLSGGPVAAKAASGSSPWLNVLLTTDRLPAMKRALFHLGVTPVASPDAPAGFVQFAYEDVNYKVLNIDIDDFCHRNAIESRLNLIPFAHNFLVYEPRRKLLYDPHGALENRDRNGNVRLKIFGSPRSLLVAFDTWLSGLLESAQLGLQKSRDFANLEIFVADASPSNDEAKLITERFLNYIPDLIQLEGYEAARPVILSKVVQRAVASSLGLDLRVVDERARALLTTDGSLEDYVFLRIVNDILGGDDPYQRLYNNVDHYMLANAFSVRRVDLMKYLV